jgi:hypothetical protein
MNVTDHGIVIGSRASQSKNAWISIEDSLERSLNYYAL